MKRMKLVSSTILIFLALVLTLLSAIVPAADYVTYLHADVQGSPLLATDEQGQVVWQEEYEPWGARQVKDTASASISRGSANWYTGKEEEASLGMYYYGARWYVPATGQFTSIDPAGVTLNNTRSFSRYAYANNNPIRYTDPDGRSPLDVAFLAFDVARFGMAVYSGVGVGAAAVDVGMSVLGVLSPVPGTGQMMKAARTADRIVDAGRTVDHAADAKRVSSGAEVARGGPDFVVTGDGTAVTVSQSRMRKGFDDAGFPSKSTSSENGLVHTVPTPKGPVDVRTMEGGTRNARTGETSSRRAVITTPGTSSPRAPGGGTPQGTKQQRRAESHIEQTP